MLFKIDENLPVEIAQILINVGHDALTVYDQKMKGAADHDLAGICQKENRILVSFDIDFADIRTYPPSQFSGMIIFQLKRQDKPHVLSVFSSLLPFLNTEQIDRRLWIVEEDRIRIRK